MTVRVAPAWNVMTARSMDDPPDIVLVADDSNNTIQMARKDCGPQRLIRGECPTYTRVFPQNPQWFTPYIVRAAGDRLNALLMAGLANSMYSTGEPTDFESIEEAADYIFTAVWAD